MANVRISDLPDAITPLDTTTTFFEVQAIENGVDVSRRVRGDMITFTVFPPPTIEGSVVRGNTTSMLYEETGLLLVSDSSANSITVDGANNNGATLAIVNINSPTGFDSVIQFRELTAPVTRMFYDSSEGDFKVRINNPGLIRFEEGNAVVRLADFDSITGQQTLYAGTSGSDVPVARTVLPASGGLEVDNQVTGAGFERVLTTSDAGGSLPAGNQGDIAFISTAPGTYSATAAVTVDPATTTTVTTLEVGSGGGDGAVRVTGGATGANFGIGPTGATLSNAFSMSYAGLAGVNIVQLSMGDNNVDATDGTFQILTYDGVGAAAQLAIRATGQAGVQLRFDGDEILETISNGMTLGATGSSNTGIFLQNTSNSTRATMIVDHTSGDLIIDSRIDLGTITFQGRDSSSNTDNFIVMTPENGVDLYYNGLLNFIGNQTGVAIQSTQAGATVLDFQDSGSATTAQFSSNAGLITLDGLAATGGFGLLVRTEDSGGTARILIRGNANAGVELFHTGTSVFTTTSTGISVTGSMIQLDNSGAATFTATEMFNSAGGVQFGVDSGGQAQIEQTDNAGAQEATWVEFNRAGGVLMRFNDSVRLQTTSPGIEVDGTEIDLDNSGASTLTQMVIRNSAGGLRLDTIATTANARLVQTNNLGVLEDIWIQMDRNAAVRLFNNNSEVARTVAAGSGGLEANNTSTGAGFERVLTTSDLGGGSTQTAYKTSTETINNDATLSDDTDLQLAVVANERYAIEMFFDFSSSNAGDFQYDLRGPTGFNLDAIVVEGIVDDIRQLTQVSSLTVDTTNPAFLYHVELHGKVFATASGNVRFRWAQGTSDAGNTSLFVGSWMRLTRLS